MLRKAFNSVAMMAAVTSAGVVMAVGGAGMAQAAVTEFPTGEFRIIGQDSGLCLTYQSQDEDRPSRSRSQYDDQHGQAPATADPTIKVRTCGTGVQQRWYTDKGVLVNSDNSHPVGRFALGYAVFYSQEQSGYRASYSVDMRGASSVNTPKWETADGYLWPQDQPDKFLTYDAASQELTLADKGADNQQWSFDPVE